MRIGDDDWFVISPLPGRTLRRCQELAGVGEGEGPRAAQTTDTAAQTTVAGGPTPCWCGDISTL